MINSQACELTGYLNDLELGLRQLGLWSEARPREDALRSTMPFCYDTLEIEQWLQFIFIGRMREILEQGEILPTACGIAPYMEVLARAGRPVHPLLAGLVLKIDNAITRKSGSGERI